MPQLERTRGHEQLPGRSNCKGPPWAAVCSHSHRDVATLRFYSSRPVVFGDDEIETKGLSAGCHARSIVLFDLARFWPRYAFSPNF